MEKIYHTICPVKVASHLAKHQGFFSEAFGREGVEFVHISDLPPEKWNVHYNHDHPGFFRDGGNIPPLWARSKGVDTILVGLNFSRRPQAILVAKDSPIAGVQDLRGRRLCLPSRKDEIDFFRAMAQRGFLVALRLSNVEEEEVEFVNIQVGAAMSSEKGQGSIWGAKTSPEAFFGEEIAALLQGRVDAVYQSGGRVGAVMATGLFRSICDLGNHPDPFTRVNNCDPDVITVSGELARQRPQLVVRYLDAVLRGAAWGTSHPDESIRIFSQETFASEESIRSCFPKDLHETLRPELSEEGLWALEIQKRFLLDYGYIEKDFDMATWADNSFLKAATSRVSASQGLADR